MKCAPSPFTGERGAYHISILNGSRHWSNTSVPWLCELRALEWELPLLCESPCLMSSCWSQVQRRKQKRECQGDAMPAPKAGKSAGPGQLHLPLWNKLTGDGNMFNSEKLTNARTPIVSTSNIYGQAWVETINLNVPLTKCLDMAIETGASPLWCSALIKPRNHCIWDILPSPQAAIYSHQSMQNQTKLFQAIVTWDKHAVKVRLSPAVL